jgi:formylglycine-generating enzyme required for sulfatase activity
MFDNTEHTTNAEQFENLLKDAFLDLDLDDPKNEAIIEALSTSVMSPVTVQHSKPSGSFRKFIGKINLQSVLLVAFAVAGLIIGFKWCTKPSIYEKNSVANEPKINAANQHPSVLVLATKEKQMEPLVNKQMVSVGTQPSPPSPANTQETTKLVIAARTIDTLTIAPAIEKNIPESVVPVVSKRPDTVKIKEALPFGLPQFTEADVKANLKQKKKMMDQLVKPGKPNYLLIPNGRLNFKGEVKLIGDFYMEGHEVTNLEYRTFLFDLLFEKKKDEYLKAKPNDALWLNCNGTRKFDGFKNEYFSNKAYDDYPVVNITAEAARMYCVWLDKILEDREDGTVEFYIDLPKESEWTYCAKGGFTKGTYPWGTDFIQNNYNCFLANFNVQQLQENFNQPYGYRTQIAHHAYSSAGLASNTDTMSTASVLAYNPNAYGLYCMSGNVAEWVLSEDGQTTKALGGSWGSDFEHLKINSESEYKGKNSSPFIGFRILVLIKRNR